MDPAPTVKTDTYHFTVYALPMAKITAPPARPAPPMGSPPISYVKDLDDYFTANKIASGVLKTTSSAQPAMFATPPAM